VQNYSRTFNCLEAAMLQYVGLVMIGFGLWWCGLIAGANYERRRNTKEGTPSASHNSAMDAIALWKELLQSSPTASGFSTFLHNNSERINAVVAQQHQ
jgi:hypothetical protein